MIDDYIEMSGLLDANPDPEGEEDTMLFTKGKDTLKTISPGGEIVDIKIKINNPKKTDVILVNEWKKIVKEINRKHKEITKGNFFEGALVEFYIKVPKTLQKGDKISNRFGAKGVITNVIPKDKIARAEHSGDIGIFLPSAGVLGRKGSAIIKELYVGKIMLNLQRIVREKAEANEGIEDIKDFIIEVYDVMDPTKDKRLVANIKEKLKAPAADLKAAFKSDGIKFNYMIPPFNTPGFENFIEAAGLLKIELDERVYIPETGQWTKDKIPVGIALNIAQLKSREFSGSLSSYF